MSGAVERLEQLEKKLQSFEQGLYSLYQSSEAVASRLMSLEQSLSALSKTIQATVQELIEKQVISSDSVMERLRKQEDDLQRSRVKSMLDSKLIQASVSVDDQSLVIVSTTLIDLANDSKVTRLAEYYSIEMPAPYVTDALKKSLLGKVVGDKFEEKAGETRIVITEVKEIYNLVEGERAGEEAPAPESTSSQPTETAEASNK